MRLRVALAALVAVSLARPVAAQEEVFQVTPYAWGIGIDGSFKPLRNRPEEIRFREGLSDVLDDLDSAFFLSAFYRNGRFVALGDYSRSRSSRDGRIPLLRLPVEAQVRQSALTLSAGYRALDGEQAKLDVLQACAAGTSRRVCPRLSSEGGHSGFPRISLILSSPPGPICSFPSAYP